MNLFFLQTPINKPKDEPVQHSLVPLHEQLDYINEGSEFLDDAIRMIEQPLVNTKGNDAAGKQEEYCNEK